MGIMFGIFSFAFQVISVKDTQNLDTLVFCFTSLTAVEAPVLFE